MIAGHAILRRILIALMLGALGVAVVAVLGPFVVALAWAAILAFVTWPAYVWLTARLGGRRQLAALVATLLLASAFVLPLFFLIALLQSEIAGAYAAVTDFLHHGPHRLPAAIAGLPFLGPWLQGLLDSVSADPAAAHRLVGEWASQRGDELRALLGGAGRNAAKFALALLAVFFLYRDGAALLGQVRQVLQRAIGSRVDHYLAAIGATTRAVVFGLILTALAQGALAGVGFAVAGVRAPVLLGALTALLALLPFGAPLIWAPIGVWLLVNGETGVGLGLLLWGALVVSWIDNLIRPVVISNATDIPFLLVMLGVLGGLAAFGLVGVFLGPVVLAVALAVWREWLGRPAR